MLRGAFLVAGGHPVHKLTVLSNSPMVQELMRRLEEASIDAFSAMERGLGEIYAGVAPSIGVWIAEAEDLRRAARILREVMAQQTFITCPQCGYDLRGHTGKAVCPECGRDLTAPAPDVECPQCGEAVPAGFEVCWSCGVAIPDLPPPHP